MAVSEALYPGEANRLLANAGAFVRTVLKRYGARAVARLGYDTAHAEAMFGAMKGIVGWLLRDGPNCPHVGKIQTFIIRGIVYHFGHAFPWAVGPIRLNRRLYKLDPDAVLKLRGFTERDRDEDFDYHDDRLDAVDAADSFRAIGAKVLAAADEADPTGELHFRATIDLRHGITSGEPLTFIEVGRRFGVSRQAAFQWYTRAVEVVRKTLAASGVDGPGDLG